MSKLTTNFSLWEFKCKDGTNVPEELMQNVQLLCDNLQVLRDYLGKPIRVISGYRSPKYNRRIGGARRSQHMLAKAADIKVSGMSPPEVKSAIVKLIKEGKIQVTTVSQSEIANDPNINFGSRLLSSISVSENLNNPNISDILVTCLTTYNNEEGCEAIVCHNIGENNSNITPNLTNGNLPWKRLSTRNNAIPFTRNCICGAISSKLSSSKKSSVISKSVIYTFNLIISGFMPRN